MKLFKSAIIISLLPLFAWADDISSQKIDSIVDDVMTVFSVPGISVGVIQNGKVTHAKGYGLRSIMDGGKVDVDTYFGIASNSKGFTATALALLVEDGKIDWDDPVKNYLPEFVLWDTYVTDNFTIRDLLSHHTGLPLGSGDLMWWPDANYQPDEIIRKMRYLKPNRGFRTTYEYNNLPFIVAGALIPAVTGKSYQEFLQQRIFDPLNMDRCTANTPLMANDNNIAAPHAVLDGNLKQIKRYLVIDTVAGSMAAAGIQCSIDDLLKWQMMHINHGQGLMDKKSHDALWQVNTAMTVNDNQRNRDKTHFRGYGLGFNLNDYHGVKVVSHGGALIGMYSNLTMVPELGFAIAIATNQQSGAAYTAIKNQILNHILNIANPETTTEIFDRAEKSRLNEQQRLSKLISDGRPALELDKYTGIYNDHWWDDVEVSKNDNGLYFKSTRSPSLRGKLTHFKANTFIVRWDDRNHEADAYVYFSKNNNNQIIGFTMKAVSTRTDFSYDFHHINMIKH